MHRRTLTKFYKKSLQPPLQFETPPILCHWEICVCFAWQIQEHAALWVSGLIWILMALCMVETIYDAPRTRLIRHSNAEKKPKTKTKLGPQLRWGGSWWGLGWGCYPFQCHPHRLPTHTYSCITHHVFYLWRSDFTWQRGVLGLVKFPPRFWGTLSAPPPPRVVSTSTCRFII